MVCPVCGANISDDSMFCEKCGNRVVSTQQPQYQNQSLPRKKAPIALIIILAIVGLFLIGTIIILLVDKRSRTVGHEKLEAEIAELRSVSKEGNKTPVIVEETDEEEDEEVQTEETENDTEEEIEETTEAVTETTEEVQKTDDTDEVTTEETNEPTAGKLSNEDIAALCAKHCGSQYARVDSVNSDGTIIVQVYDVVDGHTTTYDWYTVNTDTLQVTTEFGFEFNLSDDF